MTGTTVIFSQAQKKQNIFLSKGNFFEIMENGKCKDKILFPGTSGTLEGA